MSALQALGEKLTLLTREELAPLHLPAPLVDALTETRNISKHEARRRHLQFVGKLMRDVDAQEVADFLASRGQAKAEADATFHAVERLRDRLMAGEDQPLDELIEKNPDANRQHLRSLLRNARQEAANDKPPKNARALFRALRELMTDSKA